MYEAVQTCNHCGATLTLDDMRQPNCRYCGMVFPHQAMAAQHAQVVGQVLQQQIQHGPYIGGYGAPPPGVSPYAGLQQHSAMVQQHLDHGRKILVWSLVIGLIVPLIIAGAVLVAVLL